MNEYRKDEKKFEKNQRERENIVPGLHYCNRPNTLIGRSIMDKIILLYNKTEKNIRMGGGGISEFNCL